MKQNQYIAFTAFFLLIIYAVPVVQSVVEYRKDKSVQALDILTDAIATPFRRAARLHDHAVQLLRYADSLALESDTPSDSAERSERTARHTDEALALVYNMKKAFCSVNRYVTLDSTGPKARTFDTLSFLFSGLSSATIASRDDIRRLASNLIRSYPKPSFFDAPLLCIKTFKYLFWNDRYIRSYDKALEDNSIFASAIRPRMLHAWYVLFNDPGNKATLGRAGWLFYTPDVDYLVKPSILDKRSLIVDPNDRPLSDNPIQAIMHFKKQLTARGIDLLVVIVPGKPSIYPDLLIKKSGSGQEAAFSHSSCIINELRRRGVDAIDLFGPFMMERKRDRETGDSMYLRKDTHWKARALRCAAKVTAERIQKYLWYRQGTIEYAIDSVVVDKIGDVAVMSATALLGTRDRTNTFLPEKVKCFQVYQVLRDAHGNETRRILYKDDFRSSHVLVLGDSFSRIYQTDEPRGAGWISHLAFELSQPVASVVNDGGASTLARQSLARRVNLLKGKKLVVWEIVERDFRFGEEGWKEVAF